MTQSHRTNDTTGRRPITRAPLILQSIGAQHTSPLLDQLHAAPPPAFPNTHPTVLASPTTWSFSTEFVFTASFRSLWEPAYRRTSDSVNIVCLRQPSGALAQASAAPLTDVMSVKHQSLGTAAQVGCQQKCARPCGPWLHQPLSPPGRYFSQEAVIQQGTPPAALSSQMNSCFHKREP